VIRIGWLKSAQVFLPKDRCKRDGRPQTRPRLTTHNLAPDVPPAPHAVEKSKCYSVVLFRGWLAAVSARKMKRVDSYESVKAQR